ncbi:ABC transporter ATP-binding protein [Mycoplasmatota bacterium]|nr:ABC transporter ATP-binding protein [Mycoplasmatota bacterium]
MRKELLTVENLHISFSTYAGEVKAVRGATFSVKEGEVLAIVGESGSGKSVVTQSVLKLVSNAIIKEGSIKFKGVDITSYNDPQMQKIRGKEIGIIFQDAMTSLNPTMKIGKQIMEGLIGHQGLSKVTAKAQAIELLTRVGIPNPEIRFNQYIHKLSGGMRQRVMIAIALACNPKLLIADEPTTALDVTIQAQILDLMSELLDGTDVSIILITHDLGVVASKADRIVVMYAGQPVEIGTSADIFYRSKHPYTRGLLESIPYLDVDEDQELKSILGSPPNALHPPKGCGFAARCNYAMEVCKQENPSIKEFDSEHKTFCWMYDERAKEVLSKFEKDGAK